MYKKTNTDSVREEVRQYFKEGDYGIAIFAACLGISLALVGAVMLLILVKGFAHFMPNDLHSYEVRLSGSETTLKIAGEVAARERITHQVLIESGYTPAVKKDLYERILLKNGNRELGRDYRWILVDDILAKEQDPDLTLIERYSYGNFYGTPQSIKPINPATEELSISYEEGEGGEDADRGEWQAKLKSVLRYNKKIRKEMAKLQSKKIDKINYRLEKIRLETNRLKIRKEATAEKLQELEAKRTELYAMAQEAEEQLVLLDDQLNQHELHMLTADGTAVAINFSQIVRLYQSNQLGFGGRSKVYLARLAEFVSGKPRESNTEGGVFPAILGTVMMVLLMTIFVMPLGVITAFYLYIYAKQSFITRAIRIAVNNLAGVPSIVYGMFGLGFFVYTIGGSLDQLFYPEALPTPTFGSGGILWASLTLALLTLPVVIVSTEEGLTRIPRHLPEGSMALGATRFETLWRISLPIVSPSIMTGMILAIARATGEVAPLMLVGVVKLAPSLPLDGNFPFLHLDRKFMHLGFHIYDVGFQSPNVEAARPLIYATAALLLLVVLMLNSIAIIIRNRLRESYKNLS
ncbi:MAG: phosphate ABC transporter permease PstA [Candidatus Portiera sp.]|nr:phosphate ABC transporter permease PstA [Portiera sp.]